MSAPSKLDLRVRAMEVSDLSFVCSSMRAHLPGGFFTELGDRFLAAYLRTYATSPSGCALVVEFDERLVGFLVGSVNRDAYRRHVLHVDRKDLLMKGILGLACRPKLAVRFVRTRLRRYLRGLWRGASPRLDSPRLGNSTGILSHIAVEQDMRGAGVGKELMDSFLTVCSAHDAPRVELFVDPSNVGARNFYTTHGWNDVAEQVDSDGKKWMTMEVLLKR